MFTRLAIFSVVIKIMAHMHCFTYVDVIALNQEKKAIRILCRMKLK